MTTITAPEEEKIVTDQPEGNDQVTDTDLDEVIQDEPMLTDAIPEEDTGKKAVTGFIKSAEKKNLKFKEKEAELLKTATRLAEKDPEYRIELINEKPEMAVRVAKELGYANIKEFLDAVEEQPKAEIPQWVETHNAMLTLCGDEIRANPELNQILGTALKEFKKLPLESQTSFLYKKMVQDAETTFLEGKKVQKTFQEIQKEVRVAPRSGVADLNQKPRPKYTPEQAEFARKCGNDPDQVYS